jgi:hypothetical protein
MGRQGNNMWLRELLAGLIFQSRFDKSRAIRGNEGVVITNLTKRFFACAVLVRPFLWASLSRPAISDIIDNLLPTK